MVNGDLRVSWIEDVDILTMVGIFFCHRVSIYSINTWTQQEWEPLIGYDPIVILLAHG
jgi:hypothetical protein